MIVVPFYIIADDVDFYISHSCFQMGNSPLMYAAHGDHSHCGNELLEHGADITLTNVAGSSAFSICVSRGSKQSKIAPVFVPTEYLPAE